MPARSLTILIITIGLLLSSMGALWWIGQTNSQAGTELVSVLQTLNDEQETEREQRVLVDLLAATEDSRKELQSRIIFGDDGAIQFLSLMDNTATQMGVTLETQQLTIVQKALDPYDGLSVVYRFSGSEQAVRAFIRALEQVPFSSSLESLSITKVVQPQTGAVFVEGRATILLSMEQS